MQSKDATQRYRSSYRKLLRFYPKHYREQFAESMDQSFHDLLKERIDMNKRLAGFALWIFFETLIGILKDNVSNIRLQINRVIRLSITVAVLLAIPLVAMRFTNELAWTPFDFLAAGALLFGSGLLFEWLSCRFKIGAYRYAVGIALLSALLLIWMNLAVGIIGNEENPANLIFAGVFVIGLVGAILSRLSPAGMSRTLFAMAIAQILISVITILAGWGYTFVVNGFFAFQWSLSALLFKQAHIQRLDKNRGSAPRGI